jgi:hypothetical protein
MTLLTTEIHDHNLPDRAIIVFAADRRISKGKYKHDEREKIFRVPTLNAGIGYFGLAEIPHQGGWSAMSEWIQRFIADTSHCEDLAQFATELADSLNSTVPPELRKSEISGFHIAGFNAQGRVEFWYVRNVADDRRTIFGQFEPREDFQHHDAPMLRPGRFQVYRNGDLRAHVVAWERLDKSLGQLLGLPDFRKMATPDDYVEWVRFKMDVIAQFYEEFCTGSIIGRPVDAFAITRR